MTFLTVLISLLFERMAGQHRPKRRHELFGRYLAWLVQRPIFQAKLNNGWGAALALLPWLLVIYWLQELTDAAGFLLALPFGIAVLVLSIGPRDLGDDTDEFIAARDAGNEERAAAAARALCLTAVPDTEPRRSFAIARAVVVLANRRLVGPITGFVFFGPVGAAAYRLVHLMCEQWQTKEEQAALSQGAHQLRYWVDWIPARLTAAGYAIAGNFDAVAHAWRTFDHQPTEDALSEADALLAHTGLGALDTFPDDAEDLAGDAGVPPDVGMIPPVIEDAMALVWRSIAMWVAVIGGGSLVAAVT
jgi:AmpE protein